MNNLERRIERLEETLGMKPGPRDIILTNVDFSDGEEARFSRCVGECLWRAAQERRDSKTREEHSGRQAMSRFEQRLTRIEQRMGTKRGSG